MQRHKGDPSRHLRAGAAGPEFERGQPTRAALAVSQRLYVHSGGGASNGSAGRDQSL